MPHESYHFQNTATKKNKKNPYHVTGLKPGTMWWISSAVKFPTALKKPPINGSWKSYARGRLVNIRDIHKKKLRNWSSCKSTCIMMGNIQYFKVFNFSTQTFFLFVFFLLLYLNWQFIPYRYIFQTLRVQVLSNQETGFQDYLEWWQWPSVLFPYSFAFFFPIISPILVPTSLSPLTQVISFLLFPCLNVPSPNSLGEWDERPFLPCTLAVSQRLIWPLLWSGADGGQNEILFTVSIFIYLSIYFF